jgi:hypothetical protein
MRPPWRFKNILQTVSLVVGIVLGLIAIAKEIPRSPPLVADVMVTPASLPARYVTETKNLSKSLIKPFDENEAIKKALPDPTQRHQVEAVIEQLLNAYSQSFDDFTKPMELQQMAVYVIRNLGDKPLLGVRLTGNADISKPVVIRGPDGRDRIAGFRGFLDLGDLRPHERILVFSWGLTSGMITEETLSHQGGMGVVREAHWSPLAIGEPRVWVSQRLLFYLVLASVLVFLGIGALLRLLRKYRKQKASVRV